MPVILTSFPSGSGPARMMPSSVEPGAILVNLDDRRKAPAQRSADLPLQTGDTGRPCGTAAEGPGQRQKIRIARVDPDGRDAARRHAVADLAEPLIVPEEHHDREAKLDRGAELCHGKEKSAIARERDGGTLGCGDLGADGGG